MLPRFRDISSRFALILTCAAISCSGYKPEGSYYNGQETQLPLFPAKEGHRWGYIDQDGRWAIAPSFAEACMFREGLAKVNFVPDGLSKPTTANYGFINQKGSIVFARKFDDVGNFSEGLAAAEGTHLSLFLTTSTAFGYIDKTGSWHIRPKYWSAGAFSEGVALVQLKPEQFVYINREGVIAIAGNFTNAASFSEGLAAVECRDVSGKELWGYIGHDGKSHLS